MLQKIAIWWKSIIRERSEKANSREELEDFNSYTTTLVRDLDVIAELLERSEFPQHIARRVYLDRWSGKIEFKSSGYSVREIRQEVKLKTFHVKSNLSNIGVVYWLADLEEYNRVYETDTQYRDREYAKKVRKMLASVKRNASNLHYRHTFIRYEDSILIVANTLKEDYENNKRIQEKVFQISAEIIDKCASALAEKHKELERIDILKRKAVSDSLVDRLTDEIKFIEDVIEGGGLKGRDFE